MAEDKRGHVLLLVRSDKVPSTKEITRVTRLPSVWSPERGPRVYSTKAHRIQDDLYVVSASVTLPAIFAVVHEHDPLMLLHETLLDPRLAELYLQEVHLSLAVTKMFFCTDAQRDAFMSITGEGEDALTKALSDNGFTRAVDVLDLAKSLNADDDDEDALEEAKKAGV